MPNSIVQKLRIKEGFSLLTINAPKDFTKQLVPLPTGVNITSSAKKLNKVHWFVLNKTELEKEMKNVLPLIKDEIVYWVYYPKGTSKQTQTSKERINGTTERLGKSWKNPRNI